MKIAMGAPGRCWRSSAASCRSRASSTALHHFLEPTFADSELYEELEPTAAAEWIGLLGRRRHRHRRHRHRLADLRPRRQRRGVQARFAPLHKFFVNKWYFDEAIDFLIVRPTAWLGPLLQHARSSGVLVNGAFVGGGTSRRCTPSSSTSGTSTSSIDFLIVRPFAWLGRFANSTFERVFVNGALVGGSTGAVRVLSAAVRGIQSGYLRYYAALLLVGLTGLSAYFLISA